jgi:hypothetical protein
MVMKQSSDIIEVTRNLQNENRKSITWRRHRGREREKKIVQRWGTPARLYIIHPLSADGRETILSPSGGLLSITRALFG